MINENTIPFSVAMCVYGKDNPAWFRQAIDSILSQSVMPEEIVLVVDGPVPPELDNEIIRCEQTEGFHVIRLPQNVGHGNARRVSLENCQYEIVALMDADDICVSNRFETQLEFFKKEQNISIVGGNIAEFIGTPENIIGYRNVPCDDENIKIYLKKRCPMNQMTVMFRKKDVENAGGYLDWHCNEDYYLWIRMYLADSRFANVSEVLVNVRVGEEMYQRRGGIKYFLSEARLQTFMLKHKIINVPTYISNISKRLIVQVILPNRLRGWVFQKFARD